MLLYPLIWTLCVAGALVATPLAVRLARAFNIMDSPGARKVHTAPVPRTGGLAIIGVVLLGVALAIAMDRKAFTAFAARWKQFSGLIAASLFVGVVGLIDDVRTLKAGVKFGCQALAALALCLLGVRVGVIAVEGLGSWPLGWLAWPLTMLWLVGLCNAVNLIDGLDGLAAGISAAGAGVMAIFAIHSGQPVVAVLMLALMGGLMGFLVFNFNPARIFMGDCGSTFVGFLLAGAGVMSATAAGSSEGLALLSLALGVPIFDTLFSMLRRFLERRSPFAPDRGHLHHRLIKYGLVHRHAVVLIYAATLAASGMGLFLLVTRGVATVIVFLCICLLLMLLFQVVGAVRLRECLQSLQHNMTLAREAKMQRGVFEHAQLRIREASDFDSWWKAVCEAAKDMGVSRLSLKRVNGDGSTSERLWCDGVHLNPHKMITTTVPIRRRGGSAPLQAQVDVPVNGTLESAGLTVKFFSRLIDENSLADLSADEDLKLASVEKAPTDTQEGN